MGIALVAVLAWLLRRRRRDQGEYEAPSPDPHEFSGDEVKPYMQGSTQAAYTLAGGSRGGYSGQSGYISPSRREVQQSRTPFLSALPPPPASNATSYPRSYNPTSSVGSPVDDDPAEYISPISDTRSVTYDSARQRSNDTPSPVSAGGSSNQGRASMISAPSLATPSPHPQPTAAQSAPPKAYGIALPYTAQPPAPTSDISTPGSGQQRLTRAGRESDLGPIAHREDAPYPTVLPPDYQQATEPLPWQAPGHTPYS